jgi:SAM-dependent methyltransferase
MRILHPNNDPLGNAVKDYYKTKCSADILVQSNIAEDDVIPSSYFFRKFDEMPKLEKLALSECSGKILDVGAAAGCHSLYLQNNGHDVTALDNSELCCKVMKERGLKKVIRDDFFSFSGEKMDTILLLMNGIGIAGNLEKLNEFFTKSKQILNPEGQIIFDSSDIDYLYYENDGSKIINLNSNYYGELIYTMKYKEIIGSPFEWLFVDYKTLSDIAAKNTFDTSLFLAGDHYDYLVVLKKK